MAAPLPSSLAQLDAAEDLLAEAIECAGNTLQQLSSASVTGAESAEKLSLQYVERIQEVHRILAQQIVELDSSAAASPPAARPDVAATGASAAAAPVPAPAPAPSSSTTSR